jgi:hypothetical protein
VLEYEAKTAPLAGALLLCRHTAILSWPDWTIRQITFEAAMKLQLAAAFALVILAAPVAHAFTIDDKSNTNSSGGARYTDPDARFDGTASGSGTTLQQGNTTIRFGGAQQGGTFDQRYDSNRMFDTLGGPGRDGFR